MAAPANVPNDLQSCTLRQVEILC